MAADYPVPDDYSEYMPTGTATFEDGVLSWNSTFSAWSYTMAYVDSSCGYMSPDYYDDYYVPYYDGYGYGGEPETVTAATGYTGTEDLPCAEETWTYGGYYYDTEDTEVEGITEDDWGDEEPPSDGPEPDVDAGTVEDTGMWWDDEPSYSADNKVDVWTVELVAGESIFLSVDTVSEASSFDPYIYITDSETCMVGMTDDDFSCSDESADEGDDPSPEPVDTGFDSGWWEGGYCPGTEYIASETGTHHIIVSGYSCDSEVAEYEIGIDAGSDPMLTLLADDIDARSMTAQTHMVEGTATVTE
jgi:hypothetical protein